MESATKIFPLIPLRGMVVFPYMILHFDVGREKSILALENAMMNDQKIFLAAQKEAKEENPGYEDIYDIGTLCTIKQILKLPGDTVRVLVEGTKRAKIIDFQDSDPFFKVSIDVIEDVSCDETEKEALIRSLKDQFDEYIKVSGTLPEEAMLDIDEFDDLSKLSDTVCSYMSLKQELKQELLGILNPKDRVERLIVVLKNEIDIAKLEKKISNKVKGKIDQNQREYFLREQLKAIQEELGEDDEVTSEIKKYKKKINGINLPKDVEKKLLYELNKLKNSGIYSSEGGVIRTYIDSVLELPWGKYTEEDIDINKAREILDHDHYGLKDVKDRIIEYLAVKSVSKSLKGPILCLVGPPGVGKTSIAKSVAKALNKNFVRMSLGGVRDEAEIRGHRRTYVGAIPGRIVYGMKQAGSMNPVFLLDEIDKMASDFRGNPADALLEVLDSEQNSTFRDHYLELDMDLSKVTFILTANTLDTIPRPLLDRMEIIEVSGYTYDEKFSICKKYLIDKELKEYGAEDKNIRFNDSAIKLIIESYTRESGVRELQRKVGAIIRKAITDMVKKNKDHAVITCGTVRKYLGCEVFKQDMVDGDDKIGVVTGMAWTAYGGDILPIEVSVMDGSGKLQLTGQLGNVMQESAKTAYSLVRSRCEEYGIDKEFYKNKDIHIHVPEGAVPKDGPSAGITMTTALVSALGKYRVKHDVSMTGEITLTGKVLPIGGLKEKTLAAYRSGVRTVIIPKDNEKDVDEISKAVKNKIKFVLADKIDVVLNNALVGDNICK